MFDSKKSQNKFINDLNEIKLPEKSKILPAEAFISKSGTTTRIFNRKKLYPSISFGIAIIVLSSVLLLQIGLPNLSGLITDENSSDSSSKTSISEIDSENSRESLNDNSETPTSTPSVEPTPKIYEIEHVGGDERDWFYNKFNFKSSSLSSQWFDIIGVDNFEKWTSEYDSTRKAGTLDETYPLLVKFIYDNNISKETCIEVTEKMRKDREFDDVLLRDLVLTEEEIEIIYSKDISEIYRVFVNEHSILVDDRIYTPYWLINHSIDEYMEAGISYSEFSEKIENLRAILIGYEEFNDVFNSKLIEFENAIG